MKSSRPHFPQINAIAYEGAGTGNALAFRHYNPAEVVDGRTTSERLRLADGKFEQFVAERYSSFDSGYGQDIEPRRVGFKELSQLVLGKLGEPIPRSGKQEYLENLLNTYLHG